MNINYGDKGYVVKYIQAFLNENYDNSLAITGYYDTDTHRDLIDYLSLPNVTVNRTTIINDLRSEFSFIDEFFVVDIGIDNIVFTCNDYLNRVIFISNIHIEDKEVNFAFIYKNGNLDKYLEKYDLSYNYINTNHKMPDKSEEVLKWYNSLPSDIKDYLNESCRKYIIDNYIGLKMSESMDKISDILYNHGWYLTEYSNYKNENISSLIMSMSPYDRVNRFPNKAALCMINQFNNYVIYNSCIRDGISFDDIIQSCDDRYEYKYKLCLIPCNGKKKFTVSHGYNMGVTLYIAKCNVNYKNIKRDSTIVNNTVSIYLEPGDYYTYETDDLTKTLVVQIPQVSDNTVNINTKVLLGDLDFNGKINIDDIAMFDSYWAYNLLLSKYSSRSNLISYFDKYATDISGIDISVSASEVGTLIENDAVISLLKYNRVYIVRFKLSEFNISNKPYNYIVEYTFDENTKKDYIRLVSCNNSDLNRDKTNINDRLRAAAKIIWNNSGNIIYEESRRVLISSIENSKAIVSTNGGNTIIYSYSINEENNDNKLLVIDVSSLGTPEDISNMNIPYNKFTENKWAVHEKLLNYILGMTINEYSDESDIEYAQSLVKELLYDKLDTHICEYSNEIKNKVKEYQQNRRISFSTGYIDVETEGYLRKASNNYGS